MSDIIRRAASDIPEPFRRFLQGDLGSWLRVEEYQDVDAKVIRAELPGINPDTDVDITVDRDTLTINARREERSEQKDKSSYRSEFHYGSFTRSFQLPKGVREEDIQASYRDGVLEVRVPTKGQEQTTARKVRVSREGTSAPGAGADATITSAPPSDAATAPPGTPRQAAGTATDYPSTPSSSTASSPGAPATPAQAPTGYPPTPPSAAAPDTGETLPPHGETLPPH